MEVSQADAKRGYTWLVVAGAAAICLSFALYSADKFLGSWDREGELEATLIELRTAQSQVATNAGDVRLDQAERFLTPVHQSAHSVDYSLSEPKKKKTSDHGHDSHH